MKKILLLLTVFLLFCGCSPQKRIARIAEKYNLKQYETVVFRDTVILEPRTYIFKTGIDSMGDFTQETNGAKLYGNITDTVVTLKVVTDFDTIYIEKPVEFETIKVQTVEKGRGFFDKLTDLFFILFICGCVGFIFYIVFK
jgi:hypothetical protein